MYLSSCTYMQIRRVDLSCMSGPPTFHMLPTPLVRDGLASQTSTAHTLLYWHYRIPRMDVLIGHVCGVEQTNGQMICVRL